MSTPMPNEPAPAQPTPPPPRASQNLLLPDWLTAGLVREPVFVSTPSNAAPPLPYPDVHGDWNCIHAVPKIGKDVWIAPGAVIYGRVRLQERSSVWYQCVLRGDHEWIDVGPETNIQDGSVIHVDPGVPCVLGPRVTVGHKAVVHASFVEANALIGIGALVLSRCRIGAGSLIAAGAVVLEGTVVPPGTLWAGCPARQIRELTPDQQARLERTYQHYLNNSLLHRTGQPNYAGEPPLADGREALPAE